jgi:hypothetical protein
MCSEAMVEEGVNMDGMRVKVLGWVRLASVLGSSSAISAEHLATAARSPVPVLEGLDRAAGLYRTQDASAADGCGHKQTDAS